MSIILASGSPRRSEILKNINLKFDIIKSKVDEIIIEGESPENLAMRLAYEKAKDVANTNKESIVIGADTIVVLDGKVLGKPSSKEEAKRMIRSLSGREHEVITGISFIKISEEIEVKDYCTSYVKFKELSEEEIEDYVSTGESMDKAGAYGIQGFGSLFVEYIKGDYFNIVGLPVYLVGKIMRENFGVNLFRFDK